jgi:hypothetical protein
LKNNRNKPFGSNSSLKTMTTKEMMQNTISKFCLPSHFLYRISLMFLSWNCAEAVKWSAGEQSAREKRNQTHVTVKRRRKSSRNSRRKFSLRATQIQQQLLNR